MRSAASILAFLALLAWASREVRDAVRADARFQVTAASVLAAAPPAGLSTAVMHELAGCPRGGARFSVFDAHIVREAARAYAALPWVRAVRSVEVCFPARLCFDLEARRPQAGLVHGERILLLDSEGIVLPRRCYEPSEPGALGLPVIVRAPLAHRSVREGDRLDHVPVRHGLSVAHALAAPAFASLFAQRVEIDVSNVEGALDRRRSEIVVRCGPTLIEWGRAPASDRLDVPLEEKLRKLRLVIRRQPDFSRLALVRLQLDDLEWRLR